MEDMKTIDQYFAKVEKEEEKKEFKGPVTRKRFREELIRLVFDKIQSNCSADFLIEKDMYIF